MFEFSLASLILICVVGAVGWHMFSTKILGYTSKIDATLRQDWKQFKSELTSKHDLLSADLNAKHDMSSQKLQTIEKVQLAMVTAAPAVPIATPAVELGTTQTTDTSSTTTTTKP